MSPSQRLRNSYSNEDQRKLATFAEMETVADGESLFGSVVVKYRGFVDASGRRFLDDVIIYHYGDLLLLIAEAKNYLGRILPHN